ncbi:hypothetical protein ACS0TY_004393 [Phlomoides rotata]
MRMLSYNIRGLGCRAKCREVCELIKSNRVNFCLIQKTKKEEVDEILCKTIWGSGRVGWAYKGFVGRLGGILSLWNSDLFVASSCWHMEGAVVVNGFWGTDRVECSIVNVYAPCLLAERLDLWDRLHHIILSICFIMHLCCWRFQLDS